MSEIKVNSIKGVAASVAALSINNTDGTCTANLTNRNNRNLVINGAMNVAQRATSSTVSGYGSVDRWQHEYAGTDEAPTFAQSDVVSSDSGDNPFAKGITKCMKITNGNQTSGLQSNSILNFNQNFEAQDVRNSGWNYNSNSSYITLSFYVKASVSQNYHGFVKTQDGTNYVYQYETGTLTANTWTRITKTIPGHSSLQINNDTTGGFQVFPIFFGGSDYTDNSINHTDWQQWASGIRSKDQTATWWTTNDATLEITGVQLEVSDHASEFEHLPYAVEERLCQRYYYRQSAEHQYMRYDCNGQCPSANGAQYVFSLPVRMRANPTIGYSALGDFYIYASNLQAKTPTAITLSAGSTKSPMLSFDKSSTFTAGAAAHLSTPNTQQGYIEFKAEL